VTTALVGLPSACLFEYYNLVEQEEQKSNGENNNLVDVSSSSTGYTTPARNIGLVLGEDYFPNRATLWTDVNITIRDLYGFANSTFLRNEVSLPPLTPPALPPLMVSGIANSNSSNNASTTIPDLEDYMAACEQIAGEMLKSVVDFFLQVAKYDFGLLVQNINNGIGGITFNWIRCCNVTENQIEASVYKNQTAYFAAAWDADRNSLYDRYVLDLGCHGYNEPDGDFSNNSSNNNNSNSSNSGTSFNKEIFSERTNRYWKATKRSVLDATGGKGCLANTGSSAWFWFTIMTSEWIEVCVRLKCVRVGFVQKNQKSEE
jgi:hypothetical protein